MNLQLHRRSVTMSIWRRSERASDDQDRGTKTFYGCRAAADRGAIQSLPYDDNNTIGEPLSLVA